jgi:hypothetical protein
MTSSSLLEKSEDLRNVEYRIVGSGIRVPVDSSLCASIADADLHAISEAMKYAKDFRSITLYKRMSGQKSEIIYRSSDSKAEQLKARVAKFFAPVRRAQVGVQC